MTLIWLYETTARDDADDVAIRQCTGEGYNHPSGPGFFEPRIEGDVAGIAVQRSVFSNQRFGGGEIGYSTIRFKNPDGGLDAWLDLGFGRDATLKLGEADGLYGDFTTVISARATQITPGTETYAIGWESRMRELDEPASPATFAGTNSGTTGLEGTADDIKGQRKPRASGRLINIRPVLLNSSTRIFGWNYDKDGNRAATHSIDKVRFRGAEWTLDGSAAGSTGGDFPDAATLAAYNPIQGYYVTCKAESLIKLGGSNNLSGGPVTIDVTIEPTFIERYAPMLLKAWIEDAGGTVNEDDFTAIASPFPFEAGYYVTGDETFRDVCDRLAASVMTVYLPDRLGVYRAYRLAAPSGTPVAEFQRFGLFSAAAQDDEDLIRCEPIETGWVPAKEVRVRYAPNWTPLQESDVADAVSLADREFLTTQYRTTDPVVSAAVAAKYGNAEVREFDTLLLSETDAEVIRDELLAFFGAMRREYQVTVSFGPGVAALVDIGAVIRLTQPLQGMANGKLAVVYGDRVRANTRTAELRVLV
ncbi:hypothetical protein JL101_036015 (plasmid) [Skermanella rosea]|uniref:hypothetical protein n=1 Tax=Skermanella rosea TaxID=1817965 RepID=UPI00193306F3|nr:hypothetical protein [Skermanella rosea]UEM08060.1 hypothetical protein JL101_036015 [Skermanella rosea]